SVNSFLTIPSPFYCDLPFVWCPVASFLFNRSTIADFRGGILSGYRAAGHLLSINSVSTILSGGYR
ncbi:MAG: hypothetical protein AAFU54_30820, partial [Chloroflexota bacterium]